MVDSYSVGNSGGLLLTASGKFLGMITCTVELALSDDACIVIPTLNLSIPASTLLPFQDFVHGKNGKCNTNISLNNCSELGGTCKAQQVIGCTVEYFPARRGDAYQATILQVLAILARNPKSTNTTK